MACLASLRIVDPTLPCAGRVRLTHALGSALESDKLGVIKTHLFDGFGAYDNRTPHTDAAPNVGRSSAITHRMSANKCSEMTT